MIDKKLLAILVCPVSKQGLVLNTDTQELQCKSSKLAYAIKDGIPVMLETQARQLTDEEVVAL